MQDHPSRTGELWHGNYRRKWWHIYVIFQLGLTIAFVASGSQGAVQSFCNFDECISVQSIAMKPKVVCDTYATMATNSPVVEKSERIARPFRVWDPDCLHAC